MTILNGGTSCQAFWQKCAIWESTTLQNFFEAPHKNHRTQDFTLSRKDIVTPSTGTTNALTPHASFHIGAQHVHKGASLNYIQNPHVFRHQDQIAHSKPPQQKNNPLTSLKTSKLEQYLTGYKKQEIDFLISGFEQGFPLNFKGTIKPLKCNNLKSANENKSILREKLILEIAKGRIAGPFTKNPFPNIHFSPLGLVPKKDGNFRLIHHLSYPEGGSVNDGIPVEYTKVHYQTLDDAIRIIQTLGRGCLMAKADIQDAFRLLPIREKDHHLLGLTFEGVIMYDKFLPMGASCSCQTFERFSKALHWILSNKFSVSNVVHILDDFMFFGRAKTNICSNALSAFNTLANSINLPLKHQKTVPPTTTATLFGIEIDTIKGEMRLPQEKLDNLRSLLNKATQCSKMTVRNFQSLLGHLNFACMVVVPGRAFMRRLYNILCNLKNPKPFHFLRFTKEAKKDIAAWNIFMASEFKGKNFFLNPSLTESSAIELFTDAATSTGCAGVYKTQWFTIKWPSAWRLKNITLLELYPIWVCLELWGYLLRNHQIRFRSDNLAVVYIINKQSSKDPELMSMMRTIVLLVMKHNINLSAVHIPGILNTTADLLSRFQIEQARRINPKLQERPTHVPTRLLPNP